MGSYLSLTPSAEGSVSVSIYDNIDGVKTSALQPAFVRMLKKEGVSEQS